ncbi:hypothetical protein C8R46DRAFT_1355760 [Mycena filopes]|nr:hypothetical protein C8R46DRAFT_1355760 [Mycena filopes]
MLPALRKVTHLFTAHSDTERETVTRTKAMDIYEATEATQREGETESDRAHQSSPREWEGVSTAELSTREIAAGRLGGGSISEAPRSASEQSAVVAHHEAGRFEGTESIVEGPRSLSEQPSVVTRRTPAPEEHFIPVDEASHRVNPQGEETSNYPRAHDPLRARREASERRGGNSRKATERLEREKRDLEKQIHNLHIEAEKMEVERMRLVEENRDYATQLAAAQARAAEVQFENQGPTFGITANATSTADIRRMMDNLDAEIFQIAAALSDCDLRNKLAQRRGYGGRPDHTAVHGRAVSAVGNELAGLLSGRAPDILVQVALQTAMASWSFIHLRSWVPERQGEGANSFLTELYAGVRRAEDKRDALRWRAMTRKQLVQRQSSPEIKASLFYRIACVVNQTQEEPLDQRKVETEFGDRMASAVQLILDLHEDIGTKILAEDLEPFFVDPGVAFDNRVMESMWPEERQSRGSEIVVCTTGLGLQRRDDGRHPVILVKPRVLLRSTLGSLKD